MPEGLRAVLTVCAVAFALAALINPNLFAFLASLLDRWHQSRQPPAFEYHGLTSEELTALSIDDIDRLDALIQSGLFADGHTARLFLQHAARVQVHQVIAHADEMRDEQRWECWQKGLDAGRDDRGMSGSEE
jgi:hypothetical protein